MSSDPNMPEHSSVHINGCNLVTSNLDRLRIAGVGLTWDGLTKDIRNCPNIRDIQNS